MIQLTQSGILDSRSQQELESVRAEFERYHCVLMPRLLESGLLALVQRGLTPAEFYRRDHPGIGPEACLRDNHTAGFLHFLTNNWSLFRIIDRITRCGLIGCFAGRVYRVVPGAGHYDSWHNDVGEDRLIGMSINLSTEVYSGGVFQLRDRSSGQILSQVANTGAGDAIVFRIHPALQHRIADVTGSIPKTAFAGWFRARPYHPFLLKFADPPAERRAALEDRAPVA